MKCPNHGMTGEYVLMGLRKERDWISLDNAAKIFPATSGSNVTNVFRFSCELRDRVDPQVLAGALEQTLQRFPFFQVILKRGFFWYYLERSDIKPVVGREDRPPCSRIYYKDRRDLLFEVSYFENRINFEVFHALADGTGALLFLRTLVYLYIVSKYSDRMPEDLTPLLLDASDEQKKEDSFQKYYDPKAKTIRKREKAYKLKGAKLPEGRLSVIEGVMPVSKVLGLAKEIGVTLTEYLSAMLILAIRQEVPVRELYKPIVLSIPVNLRKYFSSGTARNFFGIISASYRFNDGDGTLEDVAKSIKREFAEQLTAEKLIRRMSMMTALEMNPFIRSVPLPIKDIVLRIGKIKAMESYTCTLSNVGIVEMPDYVSDYIERFDVYNNTDSLQVCLCTFRDKLAVTFTSAFAGTEIQKNFFRRLSSLGVEIDIISNKL
jgi:NRPS condensation-like uncharacterized protein